MVNITYVGDTLIARKVTGDENVPAGEISFQADLSPPDVSFLASKKAENHNTNQSHPPTNKKLQQLNFWNICHNQNSMKTNNAKKTIPSRKE